MKTTIGAFLVLLSSALIWAQDAPRPADTTQLQGKWEGIEVGWEAEGKCTMTVTGNTIHFQGWDKGEWYKATFSLPAGTDPKLLRTRITDCSAPDFIGKSSDAIYKIEEGKLTVAGYRPGSGQTPKSFAGEPGARVFVLRRIAN